MNIWIEVRGSSVKYDFKAGKLSYLKGNTAEEMDIPKSVSGTLQKMLRTVTLSGALSVLIKNCLCFTI